MPQKEHLLGNNLADVFAQASSKLNNADEHALNLHGQLCARTIKILRRVASVERAHFQVAEVAVPPPRIAAIPPAIARDEAIRCAHKALPSTGRRLQRVGRGVLVFWLSGMARPGSL